MSTLAKIRSLFRTLHGVTSLGRVTSPVIAAQQTRLGRGYQQTRLGHGCQQKMLGYRYQQKRCLSEKKAPEKVRIKFIDRDGDPYTVNAVVGESLMKTAHRYDIDLEGACDGTIACCTCHLVVHPDWFDKIDSEPCEDELDMLDMAFGLTDTSRLGCQVIVKPELDGMVVRIPPYEPQYT
eukprot:sb/3471718/